MSSPIQSRKEREEQTHVDCAVYKWLGDLWRVVEPQFKARQVIELEGEASEQCRPGEENPEHSPERWLGVRDVKKGVEGKWPT